MLVRAEVKEADMTTARFKNTVTEYYLKHENALGLFVAGLLFLVMFSAPAWLRLFFY
jgi:hypothetical protein